MLLDCVAVKAGKAFSLSGVNEPLSILRFSKGQLRVDMASFW